MTKSLLIGSGALHNADIYVCNHTSSWEGGGGGAKMKNVAFRINVRTFEVTPKEEN